MLDSGAMLARAARARWNRQDESAPTLDSAEKGHKRAGTDGDTGGNRVYPGGGAGRGTLRFTGGGVGGWPGCAADPAGMAGTAEAVLSPRCWRSIARRRSTFF